MHAYSQDLRDRVLGALERGERPSDIARRFEVSRVWVYQVRDRFRHHGERCSHPIGGTGGRGSPTWNLPCARGSRSSLT